MKSIFTYSSVFFIFLVILDLGSAKTALQYKVRVSKARIRASGFRVEEISVRSPLICALEANLRPWNRLMCVDEANPRSCLFSNMNLAAKSDDNSPDGVTCMTSHSPSACVLNENRAYIHGDVFATECGLNICLDGKGEVYDISNIQGNTCTKPFLNIPFVGCLYLDKGKKSWCEAQAICANMESIMVVPEDFGEMQKYFLAFALFQDVWVGIRSRKWLNGKSVTSSQWWPRFPKGARNDCGKMTFGLSRLVPTYRVKDDSCYSTHSIACYRPGYPVCESSLLKCAALMLG